MVYVSISEPWHIQNPVYPDKYEHFEVIFRDILACSGILSHYCNIFRHVQTYIEHYATLAYSELWIIQSPAYKTLVYLEPMTPKHVKNLS